MRAIIILTTVFIFLFYSPFVKSVFAGDVIINEFLVDPDADQWVELYNKGAAPINISGWFIDDSGGTQKFTIPNDTIINSGEFKFFESSYFNLNRTTPDTVQLLNGVSIEDSYSYDTGPGINKSYGRDTDGIGNWVVFNSPTKGSSNNTSSPEPTPTPVPPTPTPTPSPTANPTPTKTPTLTPKPNTPTSTKSPTPTKTPIPTPIPNTPTSKPSVLPTSKILPTSVLGESTESASIISPTNAKKNSSNILISSKNKQASSIIQKIFIGIGGIFLIACAILSLRFYIKNKKQQES